MRTKYIVTNVSALRKKYGSKYSRIETAVKRLIAADAARKITTTVWDVSDSATMKNIGGAAVTKAKDPKQNKNAVDAIFRSGRPDYILILGSIDILPHQNLANPVKDEDRRAWGDLPYACEQAYSTDVNDFLAPTRVVGRLPDITGSRDPRYFVRVLDNAATWVPLAPSHYNDYFALSTQTWKKSTKLSIKRVFSKSTNIHLSPTAGPQWTKGELKALPHFINCHGNSGSMSFAGEDAKTRDQPECHQTPFVRKNIERGTVAAVECCYGAELYKPGPPTADDEHGICQEYLHENAYGFFGSSTLAYGPSDEMGAADVICAAFLQHVRAGDSLGMAALKARQDFIKEATAFDAIDQKTLAQFNLLGDPSIHPVHAKSKASRKQVAHPKGRIPVKSAVSVAAKQPALDDGYRRRRAQLARRGPKIAAETTVVETVGTADAPTAARVRTAMKEQGLRATKVLEAKAIACAVPPKSAKAAKAAKTALEPKRIFLVRDAPPNRSAKAKDGHGRRRHAHAHSICVVYEQEDGTMRVARRLFAK